MTLSSVIAVPRRRPRAVHASASALLAALLAASCGGGPAPLGSEPQGTDRPSASLPGPSSAPSGAPSATPGAGVPDGPLPEPVLTDPVEIGAALWDPARVDIGVVSLIAALGMAITTDAGELLRAGTGSDFDDFRLSEAEVRGLIAMGTADATDILAHAGRTTLGDLSRALAGVVPGMSEDQILGAYVDAYRAAPGDLVRESFAGHAFVKGAEFTRVHLWLLLVDGVLGRGSGEVASARIASLAGPPAVAAAPVASVALPAIPSPIPGLDARDYAILIGHLPLLGYQVPIDLAIQPGLAHEGHGGQGPSVAIDVRSRAVPTPVVSTVDGRPLLQPMRTGLEGVPVTFESGSEGTLTAHGTLQGVLGVPILTDVLGVAHLGYTLRAEPAAGVGDDAVAVVEMRGVVDLRMLFLSQYAVAPELQPFLWGTRILIGTLILEWHEETATPSPGVPGRYAITLVGPRPGAGTYTGVAESLCAHPGGDWTATGQPQGSGVTMFDLQENDGFEALSVSTVPTSDFSGVWACRSDAPAPTVQVHGASTSGVSTVSGHATYVDTLGRLHTADVLITCAQTF